MTRGRMRRSRPVGDVENIEWRLMLGRPSRPTRARALHTAAAADIHVHSTASLRQPSRHFVDSHDPWGERRMVAMGPGPSEQR